MQWVSGVRIRHAQELLETTDHTVDRIAAQTGFPTSSNFRSRFGEVFYSESYVGRTTANREADDKVLMHLIQRGTWRFGRLNERSQAITVPAGSFIVRHDGPPSLFEVGRGRWRRS